MRRTILNLLYENKDISAAIAPFVVSVSYTDHAHGKADDLRIVMEDVDGRWRGAWFPDKGATVRGELRCLDWFSPGVHHTLPMGVFTIDEIDLAGPPAVLSMKAVSAFTTKPLRLEKKTRAWESVALGTITREIAAGHGLAAYFDLEADPVFARVDQREESDLSFLSRICTENGCHLKAAEEKLIVYSGKNYDARPAVATLSRADAGLKAYAFSSKAHEVYRACRVTYSDPETKTERDYTFTPPDSIASGHVLKVNTRVESLAAAQKTAVSALRKKNKNEVTGTLTLSGRPDLLAGCNIAVAGFGLYDGKYAVDEAGHVRDGSGYQTTLKVRKVLSY